MEMGMPVDILMMGPMRPIEQRLEGEFTIHRLWKQDDRSAFLAQIGPCIRGVVAYSGAAPVDRALLDGLPAVEIIGNMGVGYESVDIQAAAERGIAVTNAGAANAVDVAEHAFALILAVGRRVVAGDRYIREGNWLSKGRMAITNRVSGRVLGIIGLGNIGLEIAKRAAAFDMKVLYHNRRPRPELPYEHVPSIEDLAARVDFLVIATPGGDETRHLVGTKALAALGPRGILVNIARGSVVDQAALVDALVGGRLGGAGLEVFEDEPNVPESLFDLPSVVVQPHQAGATVEGIAAAIDVLILNLQNHFAGKPIVNRIV
jgi:lactate dehydrogenase-like 2-hydroxyacid dehydrogenase